MDTLLTQVGVGGIFTVLVLREVFTFLKTRKANGASGDQSVEFWQQQQQLIIAENLKMSVIPILDKQTAILDEIRLGQARVVLLIEHQLRRH